MNINLKKIAVIGIVELAIILSTITATIFVVKSRNTYSAKEIIETNTFTDEKALKPGKTYMMKYTILRENVEYGTGDTSPEKEFIVYFTYKDKNHLENSVYQKMAEKLSSINFGTLMSAKKKIEFIEIEIIK